MIIVITIHITITFNYYLSLPNFQRDRHIVQNLDDQPFAGKFNHYESRVAPKCERYNVRGEEIRDERGWFWLRVVRVERVSRLSEAITRLLSITYAPTPAAPVNCTLPRRRPFWFITVRFISHSSLMLASFSLLPVSWISRK